MGVREGKTRPFRGFYAPKCTFMDATVAREFMTDCTVVRCDDIYTVVSGLSDDNIICDFIPVLEITRQM